MVDLDMSGIGKILISLGIVLTVSGIIIFILEDKLKWFGKMPLDFSYKSESTQIFVPFGSMIILSIVLSIVLNLIYRILK